jgi:hypothetical protein
VINPQKLTFQADCMAVAYFTVALSLILTPKHFPIKAQFKKPGFFQALENNMRLD